MGHGRGTTSPSPGVPSLAVLSVRYLLGMANEPRDDEFDLRLSWPRDAVITPVAGREDLDAAPAQEAAVHGEGEKGQDDQTLPQMIVLLGDGAEDLGDELRVAPDSSRIVDDPRARLRVLPVPECRLLPGSSLDEDPVPGLRELVYRVGGQSNPALPGRQLAQDPDPHFAFPSARATIAVRSKEMEMPV